jgi:hypothetical protein
VQPAFQPVNIADAQRQQSFRNPKLAGGVSIATGTEGMLTGKGSDYLPADDLLSPQQSYSDLERNNANRFFDSTLRSRLNEPERSVIIVVCQRLQSLKQETWLPARRDARLYRRP